MQLCQIHFYHKIVRKKVVRVNAALLIFFSPEFEIIQSKAKILFVVYSVGIFLM